MAAAHCTLPCHVRATSVKHLPEFCHTTIMTSPAAVPMRLRFYRVVVKKGGVRYLMKTRDCEGGWRNYGSGTNRLSNRCFSFVCTCIMDRSLSAKSGSHLGLRTELSLSSAISGGLDRGNATHGEVSLYANYQTKTWRRNGSQSTRRRAKLRGDVEVDISGDVVAEDFYAVLGLTPDATPEEIKKAYYSCMKACHPDLSGNDPSVTNFCSFINEVYEVLSDPEQRLIYDEINGYTITAINPFKDPNVERDHAFVDEFTCIGCKNCAHTAPETFEIEEEFGRARVMSQSGNPLLVDRAIQTCPVDCIYWTSAQQLSLLEDEMRRIERVNVGLMLAGMGGQVPDVFTQASWRWEKRQARAVERAKIRMMKESGKNWNEAWWKVNWGSAADEKSSKEVADKYARERAVKAAAAARRWREYSRRGVDRRAVRILGAEIAAKAEEGEEEKKKAGVN